MTADSTIDDATHEETGITFQALREMALSLPGVEEGTSYGTAAFRVKGRFFIRLKEDGESIVLKTDFYERDFLMQSDPRAFFTTDHYRDYPSVLVRLAAVRPRRMEELVAESWRRLAPKRLVQEYDRARA
jgi:hypothetical protein